MGTRPAVLAIAALSALPPSAHAAPSAEALYFQGQAAYDHRDYARAIERWERSYQLSRKPGLLLNLAQAHRLAGNCTRALSAYRQFLELDRTAEERPIAEDWVHELEPRCGGAAPPATTEHPHQRSTSNLKLYGIATGSAGAGLLVIGLAFGAHASSLGDDVTSACSAGCTWNRDLQAKDAAGRRAATVGYTLDILGLAGLAGGAVLYYLGTRDHAVTVTPRGHGTGAVLTWSGSW